jgi:glycosyltransferase involved in cell wall biosynthesis
MEIYDCIREKMNKTFISAVILTYNEENNIECCLSSLNGLSKDIFIVDSFSTDNTLAISGKYTDKIYQHEFINQAKQLNWALDNLPITTEWILRLDADERITPELREEIMRVLPNISSDVSGFYIKRRVYFMGRWIRHGGYYPIWLLRIWRKDKAHCEERLMDEHIKIREGEILFLEHDIIEENKKSLDWWIEKHNNYAAREAIEMLNLRFNFFKNTGIKSKLSGTQDQRKRWIKENIYMKIPLFVRPILYYMYRYIFRLGVLDGKEGLIFHFLQGFWYRFLVDAKIYEIKRKSKQESKSVKAIIETSYDIKL